MSAANRERRRRDRPGKPATMLVFVTRIGHAPHVPAGYATANCHACKAAVWISPRVLALGRRLGLKAMPLCDGCTPRAVSDVLP